MLKINLLETDSERHARRATILVTVIFTLLVGGFSAIGGAASYRAATRGTNVFMEVGNVPIISSLRQLVWGGSSNNTVGDLLVTPDDHLNILLLGIGGEGHEGPQLTDTIIYASFDKTTQRLGLVSIPRDLAFPLGGGRYEKINAVNAYLEMDHPGEGGKLTAEAFEKQFNVRIDRVVKIDFKGFEDLVDALGGIDVTVENTFADRSFPTEDMGPNPYKWTTVSFVKGADHMDGTRALQFVRSRHGTNGEGSDFARSRRQQLVLTAIRERMLSLGTLSNPKTVSEVWTAIASHVESTLSAWDLLKLLPIAMQFQTENITTHVLTDDTDGQLVASNVNGAFMLFPKKTDWSGIRDIMANPFKSEEDVAKENRPLEPIVIEIKNGTYRTGFASQVATRLQASGYTVASTGNAPERGNERTVIYDLTDGAKPTELARLKKLLDANVSSAPPTGQTSTQFLIILGDSSLGLLNTYANTQP